MDQMHPLAAARVALTEQAFQPRQRRKSRNPAAQIIPEFALHEVRDRALPLLPMRHQFPKKYDGAGKILNFGLAEKSKLPRLLQVRQKNTGMR